MSNGTDGVIESISRELVSQLAPEELPLYPSLLSQFEDAKGGRRRKGSSDDQLLGFGAAEAVAMLTPLILSLTRSFWEALIAEAAQDSVHAVVEYIRAYVPGRGGAEGGPPQLTPDQLKLVRAVAQREARRLDISGNRAALLADAMVGALSAPAVS